MTKLGNTHGSRFKIIVFGMSVLAGLGYTIWSLYPLFETHRTERRAKELAQAIRSHEMTDIERWISEENINSPLVYSMPHFDPPPLILATSGGNLQLMTYLLNSGADVSVSQLSSKSTALHYASDPETAELLIKNGADINSTDLWQRSPLHSAINTRWSVALIKVLVENGADVNSLDNASNTPLDSVISAEKKLAEIKHILLTHGGDLGKNLPESQQTIRGYAGQADDPQP